MNETIAAVLVTIGTGFSFIAAIGILRMPDLFMRMHASTKAGTVGAFLQLLGLAIYFGEIAITMRALAAIGFIIITAPVAAHMISRAGYIVKVGLWKNTIKDEMAGKYDLEHQILRSPHQVSPLQRGEHHVHPAD